MAKFEIEIKKEWTFRTETILTATVSNGNWRAWESWQDTTEETPLTINTINKFHDLHSPTKAVFKNWEVENGELVENGEEIRLYDSLIDFLATAMEWMKNYNDHERTFNIFLCDFAGRYTEITKENELIFESEYKSEVIIKKVE